MSSKATNEKAAVGREGDALRWPPLRSDVVAAGCLLVTFFCLVAGRWPSLALAGLVGWIFAGILPRMIGRFVLEVLGAKLGGSFERPD